MRAQNLRHAATGILVRDPYGRVYVHRRTPTKDVYPAYWDFTAGGVVLDGEDPLEGARRELAEELGVTSDLEPLGEADYADEHTTYHAFRYLTTWDGPITPQPEEVAYGAWLSVERILEALTDPEVSFMPDTRALFADWLRERAADVGEPHQGRHCLTTVAEGRWVDRVPRFPPVGPQLQHEAELLPGLAPLLPLEVPVPIVLDESPLRVRHRRLPGETAVTAPLTPDDGRRLGEFLRALHDAPASAYAGSGIPDETATRGRLLLDLERMFHLVLPVLPESQQGPAQELLRRIAARAPAALVHGELAARHLVIGTGGLAGVVDWTRAGVGDPAVDLAWPLYGTPEPVAEAVATSYGVSDEELRRALDWYRLEPWYDVRWAPKHGDEPSRLADLVDRLDVTETA